MSVDFSPSVHYCGSSLTRPPRFDQDGRVECPESHLAALPADVSAVQAAWIAMSHPDGEETRAPYAPFLALRPFWKGVIVAGAVVGVVAFGFVSVSIRLGGGGGGWPLHDALHPLLGILLGPVYGPISSVLGAAASEVITPYTALDGLSPIMGGAASVTTGLLVWGRRRWRGLWGGLLLLYGTYFVVGRLHDIPFLVWLQHMGPTTLALVLTAVPGVRAWWHRHLTPSSWSWQTGAALYVLTFVGSAFGVLPLWVASMLTDPFSIEVWRAVVPIVYVERILFPLIATLIGVALWPALQRGPFSVANQLRYGLPICILFTFFFAGRLFGERAYDDAQAETMQQIRNESRAAARALDEELEQATALLRAGSPSGTRPLSSPSFRWVERVGKGEPLSASRPAAVRALLDSARITGRVQRGFVALPDTAAHSVALAVPGAATAATGTGVVAACLAPGRLQDVLSIWDRTPGRLTVVTRKNVPILERVHPATADASSLFRMGRPPSDAAGGRYQNSVLTARTELPGLPGTVVVERAREAAYFHVFEMLTSMALVALVAGGGALAVGVFLSKRVINPLDRLIDAARRVGGGDLSTRVPVRQNNELGELASSFNAMARDLSTTVQRLRANEERLRMALDAAQMGTWNWEAGADTFTWSPQTYAILGVPEDHDPRPATYLARVRPDERRSVLRKIEATLQSGTDLAFEHRVCPRRSDERWVKVMGRIARGDDGQPTRMSGVVMDITARKEAERELVAAKEEAEEMSRLKSAFLANVSHEIRTPLTSIIGFAEVLAEEASAGQEEIAERVVQSSRRLKATLDSVLDLSMIEAGEFSLDCRDVDLATEVRRRTDLLRPMAEREGLSFTVDVPESGPEVHLDPNALDRILTNLITNAIKFTEEGGVTVRVQEADAHVGLAVSDTGIGIDEAFLPDLFEAFKQESAGLQREHEGTGLGLSITKELVELMDGTIAVDTEKGAGTTFTVRLPYRPG